MLCRKRRVCFAWEMPLTRRLFATHSYVGWLTYYRGLLYSAQNIVKKDPGRARQNSLATAGTNFTKPGAQNKGDLCIRRGENSVKTPDMTGAEVQRKGERDRDWVALC